MGFRLHYGRRPRRYFFLLSESITGLIIGRPRFGDATRIIKGGGDNISKNVGEESRADADTEQRRISDSSVTEIENARKDRTKNEMVRDDINKQVDSDPELKNAKGQIFMDISAEGLRIQVVDEKNKPLFASGSANPTPAAKRLLRIIGNALKSSPNTIRIEGIQIILATVQMLVIVIGSYRQNERLQHDVKWWLAA